MAKKIRVSLGARSYNIHIGAGAVSQIGNYLKGSKSKRAFIVADAKLIEARAVLKKSLLSASWEVVEIPVQAGEGLKDIESVYSIYGKLLDGKANRDSTLFALGGGSVGDAAGFVASTYMRGIPWVGIPTTLLAQVDSSVGGKTGINHALGKNLIGSFCQPKLVVCDTEFLKTLSPREVASGLGEVLKYGIAFDAKFFKYIQTNLKNFIALDPKTVEYSVFQSLLWKSKLVSRDELDLKGIRETLNLGHTFGHALEAITHYNVFQHGEAVIWGLRFALALSQVRRVLNSKSRLIMDSVLSLVPVPPLPGGMGISSFMTLMSQDKKVRAGKIHFVLVSRLGKTISDSDVQEKDLIQAFNLLIGKS